ncbi:tryptophan synthase subunit beta [Erythrobacter sp. SD-21]|nr:tryptophan synthase subunit beta [Erythrobacter sp. SD-21]
MKQTSTGWDLEKALERRFGALMTWAAILQLGTDGTRSWRKISRGRERAGNRRFDEFEGGHSITMPELRLCRTEGLGAFRKGRTLHLHPGPRIKSGVTSAGWGLAKGWEMRSGIVLIVMSPTNQAFNRSDDSKSNCKQSYLIQLTRPAER